MKKPKGSDSLELGVCAFEVGISIGMGMFVGVDSLDVLVIARKW